MNYNDDEDIIIKISDFGFARELSSKSEDFEVGGTKPYRKAMEQNPKAAKPF